MRCVCTKGVRVLRILGDAQNWKDHSSSSNQPGGGPGGRNSTPSSPSVGGGGGGGDGASDGLLTHTAPPPQSGLWVCAFALAYFLEQVWVCQPRQPGSQANTQTDR